MSSAVQARAIAAPGAALSDAQIAQALFSALEGAVSGEHVLVLVPDRTRDLPLAEIFPHVLASLHKAATIEVMVALGTHVPMPEDQILEMLGLTGGPRGPGARRVPAWNHNWADPTVLAVLGTVTADRIREIAGQVWHRSLGGDLTVRVNKQALEVDRVVIVGPTLPHEVAGFSSGAKYLFPGISGPEMIDVMHWLGALSGVLATIGYKDTPVRRLINEAATLLPTPVSMVALVTDGSGEAGRVAGLYVGELEPAWSASVEQAEALHTQWLERPYERVISCPMPIYGELWTAAKAMYKLEPAVADGGELVIYAPQLSEVSVTHGKEIARVGYHCLAYFLSQWDRFSQEHLAVLAHSTHVKGAGSFDATTATEEPRIQVKLATGIPADQCRQLNLGYVGPATVDLDPSRAGTSTLVVPRSGEMLFRVRR